MPLDPNEMGFDPSLYGETDDEEGVEEENDFFSSLEEKDRLPNETKDKMRGALLKIAQRRATLSEQFQLAAQNLATAGFAKVPWRK